VDTVAIAGLTHFVSNLKRGLKMKKNLWWLMVVIVFIAGLLVSNMIVQATEKVTEVQWEYKTVSSKPASSNYRPGQTLQYKQDQSKKHNQDLSMLNQHGKEGWELCGVHTTTFYFKREIKKQ